MITFRHHLGGAALLTAALLQLGGCADDTRLEGCQSDRDCRAGRVCSASGSCVDADDTLNNVSLNNDPLNNTANNSTSNNDNNTANNDNNGTANNDNNGPLPGCPPGTPPLCADGNTVQVCVDGGFDFELCPFDTTCEDGQCVPVDPAGEAFAVISPSNFDYGRVPLDVAVVGLLTVRNGGDGDLRVLSLDLESASSGFSVSNPISEADGITLEPGQTLTANVTFQPTQLGGYGNRVIVRTDATNAAEFVVALEGESFELFDEPCLFSSPDVLDFGFAGIGETDERLITVGNCSSNSTVTLDRIDIDDDGAFSLTPFSTPFDLSPGDTAEVAVQFSPTSADDFDGQVVFQNSSTVSPRSRVELLGSSERCGETVVIAEDDSDVFGPDLPREVVVTRVGAQVRLDASSSTAPSGAAAFDWKVDEAPAGSTSQVDGVGGATFFEPDVPGEYVIEVEAYDANGQPGDCDTEEIVIYAVADEPALQATLSWDAAHDMDLHVLRARRDGSFPSLTDEGDLYYDELHRDWGVEDDVSDDGFHLGDDTDGFGPESAIVMKLEQGRAYQIVGILTRPASNARTFDATVAVSTTDLASGTAQGTQTSRTFTLREVGSAWIAAEVAADGTITTF